MNIVEANKGTFTLTGDVPPNSYSKATYLQHNPNTTYATGDIVWDIYLTTYKDGSDNDFEMWYMCNTDGIVGKPPHLYPLFWTVLTPDNKTAYLDRYMETQTVSVNNKPLKFTCVAGVVDTIALLNINAKKVYIAQGSDEWVCDLLEEQNIAQGSIGDYRYKKELISEVPLADNQTITITITNIDKTTSSGYVALGKCIAGRTRKIGDTSLNANIRLMSTSNKVRDESGYSYYEKLKTYKSVDYEVTIQNELRGIAYRYMESIDAKDCLFYPSLGDITSSVFGSFSDFSMVLNGTETSVYNLSVEGNI